MPAGIVWYIFVSCRYLIVTFYFEETSFILICIVETVSAILDFSLVKNFLVSQCFVILSVFCNTVIVQLCI